MIEEKLVSIVNLKNTYIGEGPIDVDDCQWIRATSGTSKVHFLKDTYDRPTYSIYVRGKNNQEAHKRLEVIYKRLKCYTEQPDVAILITRLPTFVGRDDKNRSVYTFQLEYQTGGY